MDRYLYHTLANVVPTAVYRNLRCPEDYIQDQQGSIFLNAALKPGEYKNCTVIGYVKLAQCDEKEDIIERHGHLADWIEEQWPRAVGRYNIGKYQVIDIVFSPVTDPSWSVKECDDWLRGTYGYYPEWTYDLRSAPLAAVIMTYINEIPPDDRTPVRVVRHILAAADVCNREDALLHGQWKGSYKDGTHPTEWKRVLDIYAQRYKTGKPVKYAQCWVFSEVLTCAFRFLGCAARTVYATNAHIDRHRDGGIDLGFVMSKGDTLLTTERITIDVGSLLIAPTGIIDVKDELNPPLQCIPKGGTSPKAILLCCISKGGTSPKAIPLPLPEETLDVKALVGSDDGVWNFHVWNEVYIERPDLKHPYHSAAWQCLDASPMIVTDTFDEYAGKRIFGPCSTLNLRDGINLPHDFRYLYSAVNSLYRYWRCSNDIYYVSSISYSHWDRAIGGVENQSVTVMTRDPEQSQTITMVNRDITVNYIPATPYQAYEIHHGRHPALFSVKQGLLQTTIKHDGQYYVQICCLGFESKLLSCYRQQVASLKELSPPTIVEGSKKISTLIVNLDTKQWWVQVIPV